MQHDKLKKTADKINFGFIAFTLFVIVIFVGSIAGYYNFKSNEAQISRSIYLMQLVRRSSDDLTHLFFNRVLIHTNVLDSDIGKLERASLLIKAIRDGNQPWPKSYSRFLDDYLTDERYHHSGITEPLHQRIERNEVMSEVTKGHYLRALSLSDELFVLEEQITHLDFSDRAVTGLFFEQYYQLKNQIVAEVGKAQSSAKMDASKLWQSMLKEELAKLLFGFFILALFVYRGYRYQAGIKEELINDFDAIEETIQNFKVGNNRNLDNGSMFYYDELKEINQLLTEMAQQKQYLIEENERLASTDSLTQLHNRRAIDSRLNLTSPTSLDSETNLVLYLDLDHFKSINDVYGHSFGDKVLKGVADLLKSSIRQCDYAVRLGGEEFCIICQDFNLDTAESFAERMRVSITELAFQHDEFDDTIHVTASIGMTNQLPNEAFNDTLARADKLLYRAKQEGRDRVIYEWVDGSEK